MIKAIKQYFFILFIAAGLPANAQYMDTYVHLGELGVSVGAGHYFGDLNTTLALNRPKLAAGFFFRKQLGNYIGIRLAGNYAQLGYADKYSTIAAQKARNLSFNTDVWEASISGDFNFFRFQPGFEEYRYTPYVGIGVGVFAYDPYAYLGGTKYFLRSIGTEGQGSPLYPDLKPYNPIAMSVPLTIGFKYNINPRINCYAELCYRFTNTDYLDDVSGTYAPDAFPPLPDGSPSIGFLLQDRSYETGPPLGIKGRQRGNSSQKDAFFTLQFGISFNLSSYKCPTF